MLKTSRLLLRPLHSGDEEGLHAIFSDADAMRYWSQVFVPAHAAAWLSARIAEYAQQGFGVLAIVLGEQIIGYSGLRRLADIGGKSEIELLYGLARRYWGRGYATEAASATRDFAFGDLRLKRLIALLQPHHEPSVRVALKIGMHRERGLLWKGTFHDLYSTHGV
jgi:[ribosomal protein S5]-alanine N-acetyltransferase